MNDKNIVAILAIIALAVYFYPHPAAKFLAIAVLLFFVPGFFLLKTLYRDIKGEELVLLSFGVSLAISGAIALLLAALAILNPLNIFIGIGIISVVGYFFSAAVEIKPFKLSKPDKFAAVLISIMLVIIGIWVGIEMNTSYYKEVDIGILSWPHNATVNSTLHFKIYVKNQNYGNANIKIVFSLNNKTITSKNTVLNNGESTTLLFTAHNSTHIENLASFDMYVNGKYYTNVHVYFHLNK